MGNEVATRSRTELAQEQAFDPFAQAAGDMSGGSALYAKFNGNSGEFSYGANAEEIEAGEKLAANISLARRGWICWVDSEVKEEIMIPIVQGQPPAEHTLTNHGPYTKHDDGTEDGWAAQFAIDFRLLGESHDGVEITYKTSTKSAMRPLGDLIKQYSREYKNNPGMIPIVEFSKGSYMPKEKKHGKKYFPQFKIVDWIDEDELMKTYGEGNKVDEGDENDNLIAAPVAAEKPKATKAKATKAAAPAETAPAAEDEDDEIAAMMAAIEAKKKAKAAAAAKAAAPAEPTEAEKKAAALAKKKAELAAAMAALEADEGEEAAEDAPADSGEEQQEEGDGSIRAANVAPAEDKPAPTGTRTRRRSF